MFFDRSKLTDTEQAHDKTAEGGQLKSAFDSFQKNVKQIWPGSGINEDTIDDLEAALLRSDVSLETVERLMEPLREERGIEDGRQFLRKRIVDIFHEAGSMELNESPEGPTIYFFIGVNGSGKTTTIAKLAHQCRDRGSFLLAAADTYRAAAVEQLEQWGEKLDVDVVAHDQGGDPSAVVYDAVEAARNRNTDYLFVDTAGRLHTRGDLIEQLRKMYGVVEDIRGRGPDESLLVMDASTGQNGLKQVETFAENLPITGLALTKMDSTARGGITLTVADELKVPVKLVGTGETLEDLVPFRPHVFCDALLGDETAPAEG